MHTNFQHTSNFPLFSKLTVANYVLNVRLGEYNFNVSSASADCTLPMEMQLKIKSIDIK